MSEVLENVERVKAELARLSSPPVSIVVVTKRQPLSKIEEVAGLGLRQFGVSYVQEGERLKENLKGLCGKLEWHFVGHIQSRKVKQLVTYDFVQSIDRREIAELLHEKLKLEKKTLPVLVEVNVGNEPQKSGTSVEKLKGLLQWVQTLTQLRLEGLMCMPPPLYPVELRRPFFRQMRELFNGYRSGFGLSHLSMGTSDDYLVAVEEGSTMVRLGRTLLGNRQ